MLCQYVWKNFHLKIFSSKKAAEVFRRFYAWISQKHMNERRYGHAQKDQGNGCRRQPDRARYKRNNEAFAANIFPFARRANDRNDAERRRAAAHKKRKDCQHNAKNKDHARYTHVPFMLSVLGNIE